MIFVGIDLAWSGRNKTGIAVLEGNTSKSSLLYSGLAKSDGEIISAVQEHVGGKNALIAIDAPLIVPNKEGRRLAEELIGKEFRKYDAGAHPSNRTRLSQWTGTIRGEEISKLLRKERFTHSPFITKHELVRKFFEVYPHPSMVAIFGLDKIIRYKAKPKRDYDFRYGEFRRYQRYLKNLEKNQPKMVLPREITDKKVNLLRGTRLKDYEDLLDSIFCAYIAYYCWRMPQETKVFGNMKKGYILSPIIRQYHHKIY